MDTATRKIKPLPAMALQNSGLCTTVQQHILPNNRTKVKIKEHRVPLLRKALFVGRNYSNQNKNS